MESSRIVLVDLPRMLRDIVEQAVAGESDMCVVSAGGSESGLRAVVDETDADFVIAGRDQDLADVGDLLRERPRLRVLAVAGEGRESFLFELRPTRTPLGQVSPKTIVEAIRSARWATN